LATKMLASTVQFSRYGQYRNPHPRLHQLVQFVGNPGPQRCGKIPLPQDPTARHSINTLTDTFHSVTGSTKPTQRDDTELVSVPPMSNHRGTLVHVMALDPNNSGQKAP